MTTTLSVDAWQDPGVFQYTDASSPAPTGCGSVPFDPSLTVRPLNTQVDTPSGYEVTLSLPQNENPSGLAEAELDEARVTLPAGVSINPSAANGLGGCSDEQYGYQTNNAVACPGSSKIGTVSVTTPLLAEPLTGAVYLGQPLNDNPQSGEMYRLFFVLNGPGLLIKIKGGVVADPTTGQLTATFAGNPPLPFNLLSMRFNGGERAALANPASCESSSTTSLFTSYAGQSVAWSDPVTFSYDGQGGACPASMPFSPAFNAGTVTPLAAGFSPFTLSFSRTDGQQTLSHISTTLPKGLLADLASVPLCDEAQANAGTCSPASQIGVATVGAGAGSEPFYVSGPVYLTGGYGGGPFGLSVAVPAVAGPFNLGTVVVRAAIHVDPSTAAVTVVSDPLPQILDGVPLRIQNVNVTVNRPNFTFNPTSCAEQSVTATIASAQGASAAVSSPFDVGGCQGLPFKPSFTVSTQARTSKADGASLDVKVASGSGQANIAKVDVTLPTALPSRLTTLQKACTEAQFATNPAGCPAGSFVGVATALTPILSVPLTGPAILVSHGGAAFPDLVVVLQGEGVTIELTGNTDIKKGVTYSKFETVPDAPISTFELKLPEGPHSILATNLPTKANYNLCGQNLTMPTTITGQNGAVVKQTTKITVIGCPKAKKATHKKAATLSRHSKATTKGRP